MLKEKKLWGNMHILKYNKTVPNKQGTAWDCGMQSDHNIVLRPSDLCDQAD